MNKLQTLLKSAEFGYLDEVKHWLTPKLFGLIKAADVNLRDENQNTPLILAAQNGHTHVVKLLLEKGAGVNAKNIESYTPLIASSRNGHEEIAALLLEKGADINAAKTVSNIGWTPLIFAAVNGHTAVVKMLVEKGADVNAKDEVSFTPLMGSAKYGFKEIATILLEHGADVNIAKIGDDLGWTALHFAAWQGQTAVAEILINHGAPIEATTASLWTPLMWAAKEGHKDTVNLLLNKGAQVDPINNENWTPLLFAVRNGHKEIAETLLHKGANPNHAQKDGWTPLILAAYNGYPEIASLLIHHGADIHCKDLKNETAMDAALEKKHTAIMDLLAQHGAELPEQDEEYLPEITAHHLAINLIDSSMLGQAGPGGSCFQSAIQNLNNRDDNQAAQNFTLALEKGLDILRQGYAHANLGTIKLKSSDLKGALADFLTVLNATQGLYESVHDAAQYLYIIYNEWGRTSEANGLQQLYSRTSAKLGTSLAPDMAAKVKQLVLKEKNQFNALNKAQKPSLKVALTKDLRPLGNKKRLTSTVEEDPYDAYFLLFNDKESLERYYNEIILFARKIQPPFVIEVMATFAPKIIFPEKYAFTFPNPQVDNREIYQEWIREATLYCNERLVPPSHTDSKYRALHTQVEEVYKWHILLPKHFDINSAMAKELLSDPENGGFPELKVQGT